MFGKGFAWMGAVPMVYLYLLFGSIVLVMMIVIAISVGLIQRHMNVPHFEGLGCLIIGGSPVSVNLLLFIRASRLLSCLKALVITCLLF